MLLGAEDEGVALSLLAHEADDPLQDIRQTTQRLTRKLPLMPRDLQHPQRMSHFETIPKAYLRSRVLIRRPVHKPKQKKDIKKPSRPS